MALTKLGLNLTNLNNMSMPTFDIKNTTEDFINDIPTKANDVTNGFLGVIILGALFFWLQWKLQQDLYSGGDYGYSIARSIGIAFSICSVIGLYAVNMGYFVNFYHIAIFIISSFISVGIVWKMQR